MALTCSPDGTLAYWEMSTGNPKGRWKINRPGHFRFSLLEDDSILISVSDDNSLKIWDFATGKPRGEWKHAFGFISEIISIGEGDIAILHYRDCKHVFSHGNELFGMGFSTTHQEYAVTIWNLLAGSPRRELLLPPSITHIGVDGERRELMWVANSEDYLTINTIYLSEFLTKFRVMWEMPGTLLWYLLTQGKQHVGDDDYYEPPIRSALTLTEMLFRSDLEFRKAHKTCKLENSRSSKLSVVQVKFQLQQKRVAASFGDGRIAVWKLDHSEVCQAEYVVDVGACGYRIQGLTPDGKIAIVSKGAAMKVINLADGRHFEPFFFDAKITCCVVDSGGRAVIGDDAGFVHFIQL